MSASTIEEVVIENGHGRQPAICELVCLNCGDGMKFDQFRCATCGADNPRFGSVLIWILVLLSFFASHVFLKVGHSFVAYQDTLNRLVVLSLKGAYMGKASRNANEESRSMRVCFGLIGCDWKPDRNNMWIIRPKPHHGTLWPRRYNCSVQFEDDAGGWKHYREACRVGNVKLYYQELFSRTTRLRFTSKVSVIDPLLHGKLLQIDLTPDSVQGAVGSVNATPTDNHEQASEHRNGDCRADHPSINKVFVIVICLVFGGFLGALWASENIDDNRKVLRSSLVGVGLFSAEFGLLFLVATGFFPYTWGLPPHWLPERWVKCAQGQQPQDFPHKQNVSQKQLPYAYLPYYNNYMANVLPTEKKIAVISSLCEGSSIRSIERVTGVSTKPKPKKIGRPKLPKGEAKGRIVPVRFNADDLKRIESAAKANHKTVSEWIRGTISMAMGAQ